MRFKLRMYIVWNLLIGDFVSYEDYRKPIAWIGRKNAKSITITW